VTGLPVGDPTPRQQSFDLADMVAYAGATWDWHRIHYDPAYLTAKQVPAPIVDGQMFGALLASQAAAWAGPGWRLATMEFRFANLVFAGETVRCEQEVVDRHPTGLALTGRVLVVGDERPAVSSARLTLVPR
jgi:acyl dehydratase